MNHTADAAAQPDEPNNQDQWINDWLTAQREWLARWQTTAAAHSASAAQLDLDMLRQHFIDNANASGVVNALQSFQALLQASLAHGTPGSADAADGIASGSVWQQLMQAFPLGPVREHQTAWQGYQQALQAYLKAQQTLLADYAAVLTRSLQAVQQQVEQRQARAQPIAGLRELYELWIECGEQAFAPLARDANFINNQANAANALSRWQIARNALLEGWLRAHDLPTRAELNSVHLRLRTLQTRVAELEAQALKKASKPTRAQARPRGKQV